MRNLAGFSFFLLAGHEAIAAILPRAYRPKEEIILADCGIESGGQSSSRQVGYYPGGRSPSGGSDWLQPEMIAEVPWDGSYPWRTSGVSVKFPNNDVFKIWIDPSVKDWAESKTYAGTSSHTFEEHAFKCWAEHGKHVFDLGDGTKCTSAYICYHEPEGGAAQDPVKKQVTESKFTMSKDQVTVRVQGTTKDEAAWDPKAAFGNINDALEDVQCKDQSYKIGNDCSIKFDCLFTLPNRANQLAQVLTDAVAPAVAGTKATQTGHYNGQCRPGGLCEPGYEFKYYNYEYPTTGTVLVRHYAEGDENSTGLQAYVKWTVTCNSGGFCGTFCDSKINDIFGVVTGIVGGVSPLEPVCLLC
ncbi:uncharacterized protein CTRU02_209410 [Colletotrichum truncatum]|uniref:Uncharacterized protein n=1 Tax=Colletotrichum truncatum TaxID=5467 RepID=A0ACC3YSA3_COLTU|nr:uncharacterized protein CTRU02_08514 [Colletotrichum truncatum]KAF6789815.1 hypothetical protein CTRU02_08514 [Colletotrichum truncatum]